MAFKCVEVPNKVLIEPSLDLHAHLRNSLADGDGRMEMNMRLIAGHHDTIVHIGNGSPAILNQDSADRELEKAYSCLRSGENLQIYAAPLLRDDTTREMILETRLRLPRSVLFWKAFLSGVSNDGGNSVTDFTKIDEVLYEFYRPDTDVPPMILHVHAERKFDRAGKRIPMHDREWYAIRKDIQELTERHPKLTIVVKHVSDSRTLDRIRTWRNNGLNVFAEVCPHYLYRCHEDLYEGPGGGTAFNLHDLCWPLYKNEKSMRALRQAVLEGNDWVMMGLDWACHNDDPTQSKGVKANNDGIVVGGVTILPAVAKSLVIDLFVEEGCIDKINPYISSNARRVHGLPTVQATDVYTRTPWEVPATISGDGPKGTKITLKPFMRAQTMNWSKYAPSEL
jgi:dihydroorotase